MLATSMLKKLLNWAEDGLAAEDNPAIIDTANVIKVTLCNIVLCHAASSE